MQSVPHVQSVEADSCYYAAHIPCACVDRGGVSEFLDDDVDPHRNIQIHWVEHTVVQKYRVDCPIQVVLLLNVKEWNDAIFRLFKIGPCDTIHCTRILGIKYTTHRIEQGGSGAVVESPTAKTEHIEYVRSFELFEICDTWEKFGSVWLKFRGECSPVLRV